MAINYWILSEKLNKLGEHSTENQEIAIDILKDRWTLNKWDFVIVIWGNVKNWIHQQQVRIVPID